MRKLASKLLIWLMIVFVGISLTGCGKSEETEVEYNKNVPTGSLKDSIEYATAGNGAYKLSQLTLYNELRVNGYDYFFEEILDVLVKPEDFGLNTTDNYDELVKLIDKKCFGTDDKDEINKLTELSRKTAVKQFKDQLYLMNVTVEEDNIYTESALNYFLKQLAQKYYAIKVLNDEDSKFYYGNEYQMENGEYVLEDDEKVLNPYYIDEDTIENNFEINHDEKATYEVVILATDTLAEAMALVNEDDLTDLTKEQLFAKFKGYYSNLYSYKTIDASTFLYTEEDLSVYNPTLVSIIENLEAGEYKLYQQFGSKVYSVFLNTEKDEADYSTITDTQKADLIQEILDEQATETVISTILIDYVYNTDIVIYDYVYDALYAAENDKHTRLTAADWKEEYNDYVATIKHVVNGQEVTTNIKVDDFYNTLEEILGVTTALDYFSSKMLLDSDFADDLTFEEAEAVIKDFNKTIDAFHNGDYEQYGYPTSIGEDVFKFVYYGNTNEEEILNYFLSQHAWSYYVKERPENYNSILYTVGKNYYNEYFDLSVKHILITVDFDSDGTPDDPELFVKKISDKAAFEQAVVNAMTAVTNEVNYIVKEKKYASLVDALDYVLKAFYANETLLSNPSETWAKYKTFGIGLTIEDLGSVNNSTASKYVPEFGLGVKDLYNYLVGEKVVADGKLTDDYLDTRFAAEGLTTEERIKKLIKTSYGYHILSAYKTTKVTSAKYTEEDDNNEQFEEVVITVKGEEVKTNAYNSEDWASMNQIQIYLSQVNTDDGITGLPSVVKTYINKYYSLLETEYSNDTFRNILYAENEIKIQFTSQANKDKYAEFMNIQKRKYDSYTEPGTSVDIVGNIWDLAYIEPIQ